MDHAALGIGVAASSSIFADAKDGMLARSRRIFITRIVVLAFYTRYAWAWIILGVSIVIMHM
jgi:hypothetical protein